MEKISLVKKKKKEWMNEKRTYAVIKEDLAYLNRIAEGENRE